MRNRTRTNELANEWKSQIYKAVKNLKFLEKSEWKAADCQKWAKFAVVCGFTPDWAIHWIKQGYPEPPVYMYRTWLIKKWRRESDQRFFNLCFMVFLAVKRKC
jgi:hypothetical protein